MRHRPIGIGVQGFADLLMQLRLPFESKGAIDLNREIFETIYFAAVTMSCEMAETDGPYSTYEGSPISKGKLQPDLWGVGTTDRWDWTALRAKIARHGVRNSLLVAPMPTASTAQILGNNESFEPYTSNLYTRRVLSGEFAVVNKYLLVSDSLATVLLAPCSLLLAPCCLLLGACSLLLPAPGPARPLCCALLLTPCYSLSAGRPRQARHVAGPEERPHREQRSVHNQRCCNLSLRSMAWPF